MKGTLFLTALTAFLSWPIAVAASNQTNETALVDSFVRLPACGQRCVLSSIAASECNTFTNTTCLCADQGFFELTLRCLSTACNVTDALITASIETDTCGIPSQSKKPGLLVPLSIELLGFICVAVRLYSRWRYTPRYEADDWIMVACATLSGMYIIFEIVGYCTGQIGFGVDIWKVDPHNITNGSKLIYVDEPIYLVILSLTKISILLFYLHVFSQRQAFRYACFSIIVWTSLSSLTFMFLQVLQCQPIDYAWEGNDNGGTTCLDVRAMTYTASGFSIAQDLVILITPVPLLLMKSNASLQLRLQIYHHRHRILFLFSLGAIVLLASSLRLASIVHLAAATTTSWNPAWNYYTGPMLWSSLELGVSMIVASLPAIYPLLSSSHTTVPPSPGLSGPQRLRQRQRQLNQQPTPPQSPGFNYPQPVFFSSDSRPGTPNFARKHKDSWSGFSSREWMKLDDQSDWEFGGSGMKEVIRSQRLTILGKLQKGLEH